MKITEIKVNDPGLSIVYQMPDPKDSNSLLARQESRKIVPHPDLAYRLNQFQMTLIAAFALLGVNSAKSIAELSQEEISYLQTLKTRLTVKKVKVSGKDETEGAVIVGQLTNAEGRKMNLVTGFIFFSQMPDLAEKCATLFSEGLAYINGKGSVLELPFAEAEPSKPARSTIASRKKAKEDAENQAGEEMAERLQAQQTGAEGEPTAEASPTTEPGAEDALDGSDVIASLPRNALLNMASQWGMNGVDSLSDKKLRDRIRTWHETAPAKYPLVAPSANAGTFAQA